jgi:cyclohexanone monooxygenase
MTTRTEVLVVGAGISGIGQAVALSKSGIDFLVLEKAAALGGTWRDNTYPGSACDVESHLYSYSHTKNPNWSSAYAGQAEILGYLHGVVQRHGLMSRIRLNSGVTSACWDDTAAEWTVKTTGGATYVSRFLVFGIGGLHVPRMPNLPGGEAFVGASWHTSQWNHDVDLKDRHVTLVGVGASGVQVAPHLARHAASLTIFQRTAPWVLPKADAPVPDWQKRLFSRLPVAQSLHRLRIYLRREKRGFGFHHRPDLLRTVEPIVLRQIESQIDDARLRALVTPTYRMGCKRILFSNDYYATLDRPDVRVIAGSPTALHPEAVIDETGKRHRTDVIVWATGFDLTGSFDRIKITGTGGRPLKDAWGTGAHTYNGVAVPEFPNMFILLGPNGFVTYTSVVANIEAQTRYVVRAVRACRSARARSLAVRQAATQRFQDELRSLVPRTIWHTGNCRSWYQNNSPSGTALWPDSTLRYRWRLRTLRRDDFVFVPNGVSHSELPDRSMTSRPR